jgi:hypothetical protein
MNEGWICPRCNRVWAPWVASCNCGNPYSPYYRVEPVRGVPGCVHEFGAEVETTAGYTSTCRKCGYQFHRAPVT